MVVQVLAYVASQFAGDNPRRVGIEAVNSEIHGMTRVQNAYFRPFRRRLSFVRFLLAKLRNRFRRLPERIVQRPIEFRSVVDANGLGSLCCSRFHLRTSGSFLLRQCASVGTGTYGQRQECAEHTYPLVDSSDHVPLARSV